MIRRRRRRLVRLHCVNPDETVEGLDRGRYDGHYVLELPKLLEAEDRTVSLAGVLEIPAGRVRYRQVIG